MKRRNFFKLAGGAALLTVLPPLPKAPVEAGILLEKDVCYLLGRGAIIEWENGEIDEVVKVIDEYTYETKNIGYQKRSYNEVYRMQLWE